MMVSMMQTMQHDRPEAKKRLANAKFDERNVRWVGKFSNKREVWKEWKMHFMAAVRECDTTFADLV